MVDDGVFSMGKTMPCLPPMTGNGANIPPINPWWWLGDGWFMTLFYPRVKKGKYWEYHGNLMDMFMRVMGYHYIWVNYNISLTWILRPQKGIISSMKINDSQGSGERREVVMKFTQIIWVCLKIVYPIVPNGFADHYPYEKWLFHWEYTQHFQTNPYNYSIHGMNLTQL